MNAFAFTFPVRVDQNKKNKDTPRLKPRIQFKHSTFHLSLAQNPELLSQGGREGGRKEREEEEEKVLCICTCAKPLCVLERIGNRAAMCGYMRNVS